MKELLDKMLEARRDQMNRSFYDDGYSEGHELGLAIGKHKERERCIKIIESAFSADYWEEAADIIEAIKAE